MTSEFVTGGGRGFRPVSRTLSTRSAALVAVLLAVLACLAASPAAAERGLCTAAPEAVAATPAAWSLPTELEASPDWAYAQFRGLGCERCNPQTQYCVVNPVRWEYVCAPRGNTFACAGSQGTRWCRTGQTCWDGVCR